MIFETCIQHSNWDQIDQLLPMAGLYHLLCPKRSYEVIEANIIPWESDFDALFKVMVRLFSASHQSKITEKGSETLESNILLLSKLADAHFLCEESSNPKFRFSTKSMNGFVMLTRSELDLMVRKNAY